ncbi:MULTISPECIES: CHY zinc finger protein [unclassified Staphylococcus]|uniref:CHY zinc finger protein n=1 Tax=unclassified Staphylococcus TaxID=91994 RepID=UPI0021D199FA|nr:MULTISPECIES: CHY zinc finger protein [unclassified Staphylococcus]UXR69980.1 CHY zinc finger protein [Staphylococcus sp. IVB6246]UXR72618.1 CHY zinc finger protein [Staphylococcus sp. IVB6240]UXR74329.1 CHY zinc finger protein [Staphylococcus sp. IVB6238]UXR76715.1 CHY zinc finger protein [Staphylococcus sp. IVB6233]UXR80844.1 CHY zinc finger protein [Staphylococcus sp. IVB6218]
MVHVYGATIDHQTRCKHYHTDVDIIAIKFKCCNKYYPCIHCHEEDETHPVEPWPSDTFEHTKAILCGVCQHEMTIRSYMDHTHCPNCHALFNSRCQFHYHHYFEI